ncbi:10013_t:CDS:2 [Acaulospora morrowiae]|uniref:Sterol 24-C-methyltransferase n=1 Tax=Acaulospora morrowiae TaxID=94023 RepID=A0A9N8VDM0_9GLOM|nr:10013_t:CDS:2 [Acaulospora morrowiae]
MEPLTSPVVPVAPVDEKKETQEKDLKFSKILHDYEHDRKGLVSSILSKDREAYETVVNNYMDYWYGWGECFHFCRFYRGENFYQAIARHEHYLAMQLNVKPGMKLLDIGCGVGGPAREICNFTGAHITGLNNNDYQISRASRSAEKCGLANKLSFVKGNFMDMPYAENTFDAVYAIEATCHAPKLEGVYAEAFRVLKPGGKFAFYEWCTTDKYDPTNPEHRRIVRGVEYADGIPELFSTKVAEQSLRNVGFEVEVATDLAVNDDFVTWYYPLEGNFSDAQTFWDFFTVFRMTSFGKFFTRAMVGCLEKVGVAPAGSLETQRVLETAGDCLVEGGRLGIFTPMFLLVGRKPVN